jgi:hypothetical protein
LGPADWPRRRFGCGKRGRRDLRNSRLFNLYLYIFDIFDIFDISDIFDIFDISDIFDIFDILFYFLLFFPGEWQKELSSHEPRPTAVSFCLAPLLVFA